MQPYRNNCNNNITINKYPYQAYQCAFHKNTSLKIINNWGLTAIMQEATCKNKWLLFEKYNNVYFIILIYYFPCGSYQGCYSYGVKNTLLYST